MRVRNVPGAPDKIAKSPYAINNPTLMKGRWLESFEGRRDIRLEIGCGKGAFLTAMAAANPDAAFVGIEKNASILIKALAMQDGLELPNIKFCDYDAKNLDEVFEEDEIGVIYLNFSDPWPKKRHEKRRLTAPLFLETYSKILSEGGTLQMKTDNDGLFAWSLDRLREAGWSIIRYTRDLHGSGYARGNILTEYEKKFVAAGRNINMLMAMPPQKT